MKKLIISFLFMLSINGLVIAENIYSVQNISEDLKKDADAVIRHSSTSFTVKKLSKAIEKRKTVITFFNGNSGLDKFYVFYNSFIKVKSLKAQLYDANGKLVRKAKKAEIKDQSAIASYSLYDDSRVKYVSINSANYPYTVEFEYEVEHNNFMWYPKWRIQSTMGVSVQYSEHIISIPKELEINYKAYNTTVKPSETATGKAKVYHWKAKDLPAIVSEPYMPISQNILPAVALAPVQFEIAGYKGDMASWKSFGTFYHTLNKDRNKLSPTMSATVKKLTENAKTDDEKIQILYKYLQDNTRYVSVQLGIGGFQTFDANYVETNKYGDCKALSNFMQAMLNEIGVEAHTALINSGKKKGDVSADFVVNGFNHAIVYIPNGAKEGQWLECTSSEYPANYIGRSNHNRHALVVTPEGGELIKTPTYGAEYNQQIIDATVVIKGNGEVSVKASIKSTGTQHDKFRYLQKESKDDQKDWLREYLDVPNFKLNKLEIDVQANKPEATWEYDIEVSRYASKAGKRLFIKPNILNRYNATPRALENRKLPVHTKVGFLDIDTIRIEIPKEYSIESIPKKAITLSASCGKYYSEVKVDGTQLILTRRLEVWAVHLPAEKYDEVRAFFKKVAKADNKKVVLLGEKKP